MNAFPLLTFQILLRACAERVRLPGGRQGGWPHRGCLGPPAERPTGRFFYFRFTRFIWEAKENVPCTRSTTPRP